MKQSGLKFNSVSKSNSRRKKKTKKSINQEIQYQNSKIKIKFKKESESGFETAIPRVILLKDLQMTVENVAYQIFSQLDSREEDSAVWKEFFDSIQRIDESEKQAT